MIVCECPNEHLLRDYLAGRLDRPTHEAVDEHLDACTVCQSATDALEAAVDSSLPGLAPPPGETQPPDPGLLPLLERAKALRRRPPSRRRRSGAGRGDGPRQLHPPRTARRRRHGPRLQGAAPGHETAGRRQGAVAGAVPLGGGAGAIPARSGGRRPTDTPAHRGRLRRRRGRRPRLPRHGVCRGAKPLGTGQARRAAAH